MTLAVPISDQLGLTFRVEYDIDLELPRRTQDLLYKRLAVYFILIFLDTILINTL